MRRFLNISRETFPTMKTTHTLSWTPEQGEDIFSFLIYTHSVKGQLKSPSNRPANKEIYPETSKARVHRQKWWKPEAVRYTCCRRSHHASSSEANFGADLINRLWSITGLAAMRHWPLSGIIGHILKMSAYLKMKCTRASPIYFNCCKIRGKICLSRPPSRPCLLRTSLTTFIWVRFSMAFMAASWMGRDRIMVS